MPRASPSACRLVPRLGLAAGAVLLVLSLLAPPAAALDARLQYKLSYNETVSVAGVTAGAGADVDAANPTRSSAGVCFGFEPGGRRLVPGVDQDGALVMVYVGFLGPSSLDTPFAEADGGEPSAGAEPGQDASPTSDKGFPLWVYAPGTPLPSTAPQQLAIVAPPGTTWGTWEAGYSPSNCP